MTRVPIGLEIAPVPIVKVERIHHVRETELIDTQRHQFNG